MGKLIDLHTHSKASDGSLSPAELVQRAKAFGLAAIALTDHDTVDGLDEAVGDGARQQLEVIPGIEISVDYEPEMHILGYFPDEAYVKMKPVLEQLRRNRDMRNPKIVAKLKEMGFDISMDEVEKEALGNIVGRPHIAKVLLRKGYVKSIYEAFDKYLASGRPAFFKKDKLTPEEGIQVIREAGGAAVIAHPVLLGFSWSRLDELFGRLKHAGLTGIEAYYVENSAGDTEKLLSLANKHGLLVTGGSDYHGSFKESIELGTGHGNLKVPYEVLEGLKNFLHKKSLS